MRICLISREYPPDTGFGGIATFANHLSHGLKDLGHDVEVVSLAKGEAKSVVQDGIPVHRVAGEGIIWNTTLLSRYIPYSRYVLGASTAMWEKFLQLHQEKPFDVVDTPELLAEGLMPAVTRVAPLVIRLYTPHSKFIAERFHNVTPSFDHQFVAMLERLAMLSADVLTSPSDDLARFVSTDLNYPLEQIAIVRNPVDANVFSPDGEKALKSDGRLTVLFVGRLEARKGIKYLVDAVPRVVSSFKNVRFVIIGDDTNNGAGQKSVLAELKDSIKYHKCEQYIEFIPRIPLSELPAHYRSADICIVPSLYDNSPYTCLEAMACGRPVIGTSGGGTAEYVVDGESGLIVPPADSPAIAEALLKLLSDASERQRFGANARARVLEQFQRAEIARQTVDLYEQACRNFAARRQNRIYMREPQQAFADADNFLASFDKMLYDELYRQSYRFRISHWLHHIIHRPKLSAAKIGLKISKAALKIAGFGRPSKPFPESIVRLEETVRTRGLPSDRDRAKARGTRETVGARK